MDIKNIAREKGMRFEDIAKEIGITKGGLSKALKGNPTLKTLRSVARVLNVPVTEFFRDEVGGNSESQIEPKQKCPYCGHDLNIKIE